MGITTKSIAENFKTFKSINPAIYDAKHDNYPCVPKSLDEIKKEGDFALTEENVRIAVWASYALLKCLFEGIQFASDETFDFCAVLYKNIYVQCLYKNIVEYD